MKTLLILLLFVFSSAASFASDSTQYAGVWVSGGVKKEGPALFLFPDGKAYLHAMCGSAAGTWSVLQSSGQISVTLQEEPDAPVQHYIFQLDDRKWLVKTKPTAAAKDKTTHSEHDEFWELEKSDHALPKVE
jgi:predicted nucleotidyltransferase